MSIRRRTYALVALVAACFSGSCTTKVADYGCPTVMPDNDPLGDPATWTGHLEGVRFPSGSDAVTLVIDSRSGQWLTGRVVFGESAPPPMSPCAAYPPALDVDGDCHAHALSEPTEGFVYPWEGSVDSGSLLLSVNMGELLRQWCEAQVSYPQHYSEREYEDYRYVPDGYGPVRGVPEGYGPVRGDLCSFRGAEPGAAVIVECGRVEFCDPLTYHLTDPICECGGSECWAPEIAVTLDLHREGEQLVGWLVARADEERDMRLSRAADHSDAETRLSGESIPIVAAGCFGDPCDSGADCIGGWCVSGSCEAPSCSDGVQNGDEVDVDCGWFSCWTPCATGKGCQTDPDCSSGICVDGVCQDLALACDDDAFNGWETDVDCGGLCSPCTTGFFCYAPGDCETWVCDERRTCGAPSCTDGYRNGDETDVDCGGTCTPCSLGQRCDVDADCQDGACLNHACQEAHCDNGELDDTESDTDCGGANCAPCDDGRDCSTHSDCESRSCSDGSCRPPTCSDGIQNGEETDVDCGGGTCAFCDLGQRCLRRTDCYYDFCAAGECTL